MRACAVLAATCGAVAVADAQGGGQQLDIPEPAQCVRCAIHMASALELRPSSGSEFLTVPLSVSIDGRGRYWVATPGEPVRIFGQNGSMLGMLGRKGRGPGEFMGPFGLTQLPGDSMLVFDIGENRAVVVDADLHSVRSIALPGTLYPAVPIRWPAVVALSGNIVSVESSGWPLHLLSLAASPAIAVRSFGLGDAKLIPRRGLQNVHRLAPSRLGEFWSCDQLQYRCASWDVEGKAIQTFIRNPPWFKSVSEPWIGNPGTPPPPQLTAVVEDSTGMLWLFARVAAPNWKSAWPKVPAGAREVRSRDIAYERLFATEIEVINPTAGRVVARLHYPRYVIGALPNGEIVEYVADGDGNPVVRVAVVSLVVPR